MNNQSPGIVTASAEISSDDFRRRIGARQGGGRLAQGGGDHLLNGGMQRQEITTYKDAAVLFGIIERPGGARVLLTTRSETLSSHQGQVALPGGRIEASDPSPESAALRETHEEVGIMPSEVTVLGSVGDYYSGSGYRVRPVVGIIDPGFRLTINEHEVADVFEVPLAFLMDTANHQLGSAVWNGKERYFYKMPYGEGNKAKPIWGVTAGIIRLIYDRVYG